MLCFWCRFIRYSQLKRHQKHRVSVRPSGRRGLRVSGHRVNSRCGRRGRLQHDHNLAHVGARVGRAQHNHRLCIHPNGHHADGADAHRARNRDDRHGELRRDRNQGHGHAGARASQQNYATRLVILTETYRVILASESFLTHCGVRAQEQTRYDWAP